MSFRVCGDIRHMCAVCLGVVLLATPARAQDVPLAAGSHFSLFTAGAPFTIVAGEHVRERHATADGRTLVPLYISFAALQMLDAHSTLRAVGAGGVEQNPLLQGLANKPAALVALKAGVAVSTIALADKVRGRSRLGAIVLMAALDSVYTAVVVRNYRTVP